MLSVTYFTGCPAGPPTLKKILVFVHNLLGGIPIVHPLVCEVMCEICLILVLRGHLENLHYLNRYCIFYRVPSGNELIQLA